MIPKPKYHFLPPHPSWLNDPNGLIFWRDQYHLFYQWNPDQPKWDNIHWGHAVSDDLLHWNYLPVALAPEDFLDSSGCWSGCAIEHEGQLKLIYTAVRDLDLNNDRAATISIALASSSDGIHFEKHPKPLLEWQYDQPIDGKLLEGFRDPVVWLEGSLWKMSVGAGIREVGGSAALYESDNLLDWCFVGWLALGDLKAQQPVWTGSVWECSQMIPFDAGAVLLMSVWYKNQGYYTAYLAGQYGGKSLEVFSSEKLDWGNSFYAPQAFRDASGNWIMFGWLTERLSLEEQMKAGWSGCMSVPRVLSLEGAKLLQKPAPQLQTLRGKHWQMAGQIEGLKELKFHAEALELQLKAQTSQTLEPTPGSSTLEPESGSSRLELILHQSADGSEVAKLVWDPGQSQLRLEGSLLDLPGSLRSDPYPQMPLKSTDGISLHIFTDATTIEVFCQGQALSTRIYPKQPNLGLSLNANAPVEQLEVWELG